MRNPANQSETGTAPWPACELIAFDLDGTLLASHEFAPAATQLAFADLMQQLGLEYPPPSLDEIRQRIGKPWREFYQGLLPEPAKGHYVAFHAGISARELHAITTGTAQLFANAEAVLGELRRRGYALALISNASTDYFHTVIDAFGLRRFFGFAECLGDREGYPKHAMLANAMRALGVGSACTVGDKAADFEAATHHGFPSIALRHGYGTPEEWALATRTANGLDELLNLFPEMPHRKGQSPVVASGDRAGE